MDLTGRVEFRMKAMSKGLSAENIHILILQEKNGTTIFPIPVTEEQNRMIVAAANPNSSISLLMDSVRMLVADGNTIVEGVSVDSIADGEYKANIFANTNGEESIISSNASSAIVMALTLRVPLYVSEQILQQTHVDMEKQAFTFPITTLSTEVLKSALQDAVRKEQYEVASFLRDELKRRK